MVKLLRLTTDDNNGIFKANFKNPITINPNSKLALLHFTAQVKLETIVINYENNLIEFEIAGELYQVRIPRGTFGRGNYLELFKNIENALNLGCIYSSATNKTSIIGVMWRVRDVDNKVVISYDYNNSNPYLNFLATNSDINISANGNFELDNNAKTPPIFDYSNGIITKKSISLGNGYIRSRINFLNAPPNDPTQDTEDNGYLIGLTKSDLTARTPNSLSLSDINYGIGVGYDQGDQKWKYYTIINGNITFYNIEVDYLGLNNVENATLEVMKNGNKVDIGYYRKIGADYSLNVLNTEILIENEELFGLVVLKSNNNYVKANIRWTPTTEITNSNTPYESEGLDAVPQNRGNQVFSFLRFGSITLANFLGFESVATGARKAKFHTFTADKEFDIKKPLNTYILELLNLNVESYDSQTEQRKNIIASVLTADENGVINNENNVIFIDLNNKNKIDLRNISLRLVGLDYTKIDLDGRSICSLLIGDDTTTSF